ncbi:chemotaxis protein CheB [Actinoplanes sp. KI2]|uniref:chemotaxis protein CheB n=1 Tax=Actinoplanes sp. KI2 TaxID=2983315 RepID=UPI0021D57D40|nr:chemotaxis protein CheB [Actinoplanes sp. KI2]MCU7726274.1 chemotaxis protein CheB [Actinoplanes sp. KI2]
MAHRDVVVVGASAGGVEALRAMAGGLPADLAAAVLVVLHMPRDSHSALARILARSGPLPARTAFDGEPLVPGRIYVAPPDRHLLLLGDRLKLSHGPSENGHRPAVDPLFRSAARSAGPRVIAVVLSGSRDDGAVGAASVAAAGGVLVAQRPGDALNASMPQAVIDRLGPEHVADAADLGGLIARLTAEEIPDRPPADPQADPEVAIEAFVPITTDQIVDQPAVYGCPSCGGGLFEMETWPQPRYRCRVGHAWSPESLIDEQAVATEGALWTALRALEEKSALSRRMAGRDHADRDRFAGIADDAESAGRLIRDLLTRMAASTAAQVE